MSTIFITGIYGVGKSTLCCSLSEKTSIPHYSAGDLISQVNGETYGANKVVSDKNRNQDILVDRVTEIIKQTERIILAGHFCIINKADGIDNLPSDVFKRLHICRIILLESEVKTIIAHLNKRDGRVYTRDLITQLIQCERQAAQKAAKLLNIPLYIHQMQYSTQDIKKIIPWL